MIEHTIRFFSFSGPIFTWKPIVIGKCKSSPPIHKLCCSFIVWQRMYVYAIVGPNDILLYSRYSYFLLFCYTQPFWNTNALGQMFKRERIMHSPKHTNPRDSWMCARKWGQGSESAYIKPKTMQQVCNSLPMRLLRPSYWCWTRWDSSPSPALAEIIYALLISIGGDDWFLTNRQKAKKARSTLTKANYYSLWFTWLEEPCATRREEFWVIYPYRH